MATTKGKLLARQDRELCEKIAELNIVLVSRRAKALLMLDDGHTQAKSAELSALTVGQLRYLLILFKKRGTELFPPEVTTTLSAAADVTETAADSPAKDDTPKEKTKKKKKKGKKSSAGKKERQKEKRKEEEERQQKEKGEEREKEINIRIQDSWQALQIPVK